MIVDPTADSIDIGVVIAEAGVPASTLHVWERHGLLQPLCRRAGRRQYPIDVLARIATIVLLQRSGFSLDEIGVLLGDGAFTDGKEPLVSKRDELIARRHQLDEAIDGLTHAIDCPAPSPLSCEGFLQHLSDVLPIRPPRGVG